MVQFSFPSAVVLCVALVSTAGFVGCVKKANKAQGVAEFRARGVSEGVVAKVEKGQSLYLDEVVESTNKGVSDASLIGHMQSTGSVYHLRDKEVQMLKNFGVSSDLVNYMISTSTAPRRTQPASGYTETPESGASSSSREPSDEGMTF